MKLTIKSGESVGNALQYLQDFLSKYKEDYPILIGNMNVYITIKGFGNVMCPENEKEFVLSRDGVEDTEPQKFFERQEWAKKGWEKFVSVQLNQRIKAFDAVEADIHYLNTAEKNGRKPATINKRKAQLELNRKILYKADKTVELVQKLNTKFKEGTIKWYFQKKLSSKSLHTYEIVPYIIFGNIDGEYWHFAAYESKWQTPYGSLRKGLPKGYVEE